MIKTFLKGIAMGICDLVPGISGGTIAFITGIYEKLISAVKGVSFELGFNALKSPFDKKSRANFLKNIKEINLPLLIPLGMGIASAIFLGAGVMDYLLETYLAYTMAFFIGLILASSSFIYREIKHHNKTNTALMIFFFLIGISLSFLVPAAIANPSLPYLFLGGFIGISAMFLPGISGSFILLIMGLYEFIIDAIRLRSFDILIIFAAGAAIGAYSISRFISFLFSKWKNQTLYSLLGLVIGSLSVPIRRVMGEQAAIAPLLFFAILGLVAVVGIEKIAKKKLINS